MDVRELKKRDIAQSARELFADYGYKSVSMDQIASKANVAKGTVYLYYKDKEDLFYSLALEFLHDIKAFIVELEGRKLSLFQEIHEAVYNLLMYRQNQKFIYKSVQEAEEFKTPTAIRFLQMLDNEISKYLEKRLQAAIEDGYIKQCNVSVLSFVIIRVYKALAFEWEEKHEPLDEKQIAESVMLFIKDGLQTKNRITEH